MTNISFYHTTLANQEKFTCQLLEKCYKSNYKVLVRAADDEAQESLNKTLWTFAQKSFIPHGSALDPHPELQPIYITCGKENPNQSNVLMLYGITDGIYDEFERVFVVFDGNDGTLLRQVEEARVKLHTPSNNVQYYKQNPKGGWEAA